MNLDRRTVLKGAALGGLAGVGLSVSGLSLANGALGGQPPIRRPDLLLVAAGAESAFVQGAQAAAGGQRLAVERCTADLAYLRSVEQRLRSGKPLRLIGLVDDASAELLVELARSAGARVQWLGQHSASANASQHRVLSAEAAHGCAAQLGQQLNACGSGFVLHEQRPLGGREPLALAARQRQAGVSSQWATTLGFALAALGTPHTATAPLVATSAPLRGHFVSFSIET